MNYSSALDHFLPLLEKIACPRCHDQCALLGSLVRCSGCGNEYPIVDGIVDMRLERRETHWDKLYDRDSIAGVLMPDIFSRATNLKQVVEQAKSAELTAWWAFPPLLPVLHEQGIKADWAIEIGCGSGITSAVLRMMGMVQHCILLDISRSALLYTQQLFNLIGETAFFIQADACNSPVRTGSCDLAHSGGLIEHFVEDACATIVSEHCRVANCVGITVPANMPGYWVLRAYITLLNGLRWPFGFEQPLGRDQIFHLIEKNGCKIVSYRPRNVIQATMQRIASRFSNRTGTILYRVSDLRSPSFFDMELTVLAKKDVAYHEGV